jgi:hypothetical protein
MVRVSTFAVAAARSPLASAPSSAFCSTNITCLPVLAAAAPTPNPATQGYDDSNSSNTNRRLRHFPQVWLGFGAIFACMGAEVLAGDGIGTYGNELHLPLDGAVPCCRRRAFRELKQLSSDPRALPRGINSHVVEKHGVRLGKQHD